MAFDIESFMVINNEEAQMQGDRLRQEKIVDTIGTMIKEEVEIISVSLLLEMKKQIAELREEIMKDTKEKSTSFQKLCAFYQNTPNEVSPMLGFFGYSKDADGWAKGPPPPYNFAEGLCEIVSNLLRKMEEKKRKEELK